jgi:putative N6-adenine-specific DNA methylase
MFDGKMSVFREEGGVVKTEEEKRQMAEKRRFRQNREFKKRLDEQEENAGADIRNFKFHSLERKEAKKTYEARESRNDRDFKERGSKDKGAKNFKNGRRGQGFKSEKPFKKNNRRFRDDED